MPRSSTNVCTAHTGLQCCTAGAITNTNTPMVARPASRPAQRRQMPRAAGHKTGVAASSMSNLRRNVGKHLEKHDVRHQQRQRQVQSLAAHVQAQRLATPEIMSQLATIRSQADAHKAQTKEA